MGGVDGHFARPIRPSMPSIRRLLSPGEKLVGRFLDPRGHHEGSRKGFGKGFQLCPFSGT